MRECGNCKVRAFPSWGDCIDFCIGYEMAESEADRIREANNCPSYVDGDPDCLIEGRYTPSATAGDYSPSSPWNAPGMSIHDFI